MYTQYQFTGTTQDLEDTLTETIRGLILVRDTIPSAIASYLPNEHKDYDEIIDNLNKAITNFSDLILRLDDNSVNRDHIKLGLTYVSERLLKELLEIVTLEVGKRYAARLLRQDAKLMAINQMSKQIIESEGGFATLRKRHENYNNVIKTIQFITVDHVEEVEHRMRKMGNLLSLTNASVIESMRHQSVIVQSLAFAFNFVRYFIDSDQADIMVANYLRKPDAKLMQKLWNLGETECLVARATKCLFQQVKTVKKIHLPRFNIPPGETVDIYTPDPHKVQVRIISNHPIQLYGRTQCCGCLCCKGCPCGVADVEEQVPNFETIMVHIHGGGFVALSSFSMQSYTRKWAIALNIPIFSIDYRLSPQSAFPDALDDCWYAYQFLVKEAFKYMNVRPKKIIIAGDSAGGNLTLTLTGLLMKREFQLLPYGIYLAYPSTDFREVFSPSRIHSLDDTLLFTNLLFICRQAYLDKEEDHNPLVSPILLSEGWLKGTDDKRWPLAWPKTRLIVGEVDPLFDDSFSLMQKMVASRIDLQAKVFQGMGHALLSLDVFVPQCNVAIEHSISQLRELLQ